MSPPVQFAGALAQLHEEAETATGLSDFGDDRYREGMQILLQSYDESARFGGLGRHITWASAVNCLRGRLYAVDGIKRNPDCRLNNITKPLFIVGLPRTGTTTLHRLLASEPRNQGLEYWLGNFPQPRPPLRNWQNNERYTEVANSLRMLDQLNPEMKKIHEMSVDGVDECRLLLMQSFANVTFQSGATVPRYEDWLYEADMHHVYKFYAETLKLIGMHDAEKRWVLKDPSHLWAMQELLRTFPDATVIQTHRDPVKLIPSVSSLVFTARRMQEPDIEPETIGRLELQQWQRVLSKTLNVRRQHPGRFIDVMYDDFVREPITAVETIYRQLGENQGGEESAAMRRWQASHPQGRHGEHNYKAEDFGLSAGVIREHFADYCDYFGV